VSNFTCLAEADGAPRVGPTWLGVRKERMGRCHTCTATEMSAAWKRRTVSPIQLAFTSGTFISASADALMIRSVTDSFPPLFSNPLFSIDRACRDRQPSRVTRLSSAASAIRMSTDNAWGGRAKYSKVNTPQSSRMQCERRKAKDIFSTFMS
jgi:hypothetical protein